MTHANRADAIVPGSDEQAARRNDETLYSLERAKAVLLVLAGMALQWAALHSITFVGTVFFESPVEAGLSLWTVNSVTTFGVFLALFLAAERVPSLLDYPPAMRCMAACLAAGAALLVAGNLVFASSAMLLAGNLLIALGTTPLIVVWGELYKYLNPQNEQLLVTLAGVVLSVVIYMVEIHLPQGLAALMFVCLPLASLACLLAAHRAFSTLARTWAPSPHAEARKSPALLFVCIAVFSIPYDYLRSGEGMQGVFGELGLWSQILSVTIVIMLLAAVAECAAEKHGLLLVPSLVLLLLSAALVLSLLPRELTGGVLTPSLLYAGYYLFLAMVYSALGPVVATTSTNPVRLFAGAMLANVGGLLLGGLLGNLVELLGEPNSTMVVLGITYTVFIVGLVVFNTHSYSIFRVNYFSGDEYSFEYLVPVAPLGTHALVAAAGPQEAATSPDDRVKSVLDAIASRCASLAAEGGLSAREAEVLVELARGRTLASIASSLVVSENTVKAHTKAIYRKLDVHTREELLNRVEQAGE